MKFLNLIIVLALFCSTICFKSSLTLSKKQDTPQKEEGKCIQPEFIKEDFFEKLLSELKSKTPAEIEKTLPAVMKEAGGEMLSPEQTIKMFTEIDFGKSLQTVLETITDHIWITSHDLKRIVSIVKSLKQRKEIVGSFYHLMVDHDKVNLLHIRDQLDCSDKKIMDQLSLEFTTPKNCYFGDLSGDSVFVIDLSGSMMFQFLLEGKYLTRLAFLKQLFAKAINSLSSKQKVQIVTFSTTAKYISGDASDMMLTTQENKEKLIQEVNDLKAGFGDFRFTNISDALEKVFDIKSDFKRVVFFTDGLPTRGILSESGITQLITKLQEKRASKGLNKISVNVNLLMLGGGEDANFRTVAKRFSKLISDSTGGIVKNYDSGAPTK